MKIKIEKLYFAAVRDKNGRSALETLMGLKLPVEKSFALNKAMKKIEEEVTSFNKVRNDLLKDNGDEVLDNGKPTGQIAIKPEKKDFFDSEIKKLLDVEVEIELPVIKIAEISGQQISSVELAMLDFIIKE